MEISNKKILSSFFVKNILIYENVPLPRRHFRVTVILYNRRKIKMIFRLFNEIKKQKLEARCGISEYGEWRVTDGRKSSLARPSLDDLPRSLGI